MARLLARRRLGRTCAALGEVHRHHHALGDRIVVQRVLALVGAPLALELGTRQRRMHAYQGACALPLTFNLNGAELSELSDSSVYLSSPGILPTVCNSVKFLMILFYHLIQTQLLF